jgi:hypothetical protein
MTFPERNRSRSISHLTKDVGRNPGSGEKSLSLAPACALLRSLDQDSIDLFTYRSAECELPSARQLRLPLSRKRTGGATAVTVFFQHLLPVSCCPCGDAY